MKFNYSARDETGVASRGVIEAHDAKSAAGLLREKKLFPIKVTVKRNIIDIIDISGLTRKLGHVSTSDVANMTRQLSTMITAGLPLIDALNLLKLQSLSGLAPVIGKIVTDVQEGSSLSEAMSRHPAVFSKVYTALVKAGETGGVMEKVLNRLADTMEKSQEFKGKVKGAMVYPVIILVGMIGVMIVMMVFVVPKMTSLYQDFGVDLPVATKIVVAVSNFLINFWWLAAILTAGLVIGAKRYLKSPLGRRAWDKIAYKIPVMGKLNKEIMLTELTKVLGILVGTGVPMVESLGIVAASSGNTMVEAEVRMIASKVEKGFPISISFAESPNFPPIVGQMLSVGEETGKIDEVLGRLSAFYEGEAERKVKGLTTAIEPIILIILGVGVGFLMFAIITPLYDITNKI